MAILTSSIIFILTFLLSTTSSFASSPCTSTSLQSFIQCFLDSTEASPDLLYTSNSTCYKPILESAAQNLRFLASNTNRKPSAIVTPTSESQISETVKCAYKHRLELRTRSGGHDYEGMSYVSDDTEHPFIVIDLQRLRSIDVDAKGRTAWVQAGATTGEVYYYVFNKTNGTAGFSAGIYPKLGVGGHISVGGIGANMRKFGLAADNVVDAKVVGIDGRVLNRSGMGEDLFWAIRGGGTSFGVIVAYKLQLVDVPPVVTVFSVYRNLNQNATQLVTEWQEIGPKLDENLSVRAIAQATTDDSESMPNITIQVQFISLFFGNHSQLLSEMDKSFPELGLKAEDCTEMNWLESVLFQDSISGQGVEVLLDRTPMFNSSFKAKSDFVTKPIAEAEWEKVWRALVDLKAKNNVGLQMIMEPWGGRLSEMSESAIPFPHRRGNLYNIQYYSLWSGADEQENQNQIDSIREFYRFMTPYVSSNPRTAYYGYKDIDLGGTYGMFPSYSRAREWGEKYFKGNFERLATVKRRVDPMNFFRNEQSIPPLYYLKTGTSSSPFEE